MNKKQSRDDSASDNKREVLWIDYYVMEKTVRDRIYKSLHDGEILRLKDRFNPNKEYLIDMRKALKVEFDGLKKCLVEFASEDGRSTATLSIQLGDITFFIFGDKDIHITGSPYIRKYCV